MNKIVATILTAGILATSASTAFAGGISNEVIRRTTKGTYDLDVNTSSVSKVRAVTNERYVKADFVGENAGVNASYSNGNINIHGFANNIENPDPWAAFGEVNKRTVEHTATTTDTQFGESGTFTETSNKYELAGY